MNITYVCKSCACLNLFLFYFPSFPFFALLFLSEQYPNSVDDNVSLASVFSAF